MQFKVMPHWYVIKQACNLYHTTENNLGSSLEFEKFQFPTSFEKVIMKIGFEILYKNSKEF